MNIVRIIAKHICGGLVMLALCILMGCKSSAGLKSISHKEVDSLVYTKTDSRVLRDSVIKRDSIIVRDSIVIRQMGDTVYTDRWHWRYLYNFFQAEKTNLSHRDSIAYRYISVCDTIREPQLVERELSRWERIQMAYAKWSMGAICVLLFWLGYKIYKRIRNA